MWLTSGVSVVLTYVASYLLIPGLGDGTLWWKLSTVITCGTLAGAIIPEFVKVFTSTESGHVREVVTSAREGGASLNILSGLVAGNFSAYWLGMAITALMGVAYLVSTAGLGGLMVAPAVFAFGLVAFGFLGMGPVTIAVDSYGPVTDNAQSVFELSLIEQVPGIRQQIQKEHGFDVDFERAKTLLEENDGAGNTFKATAKPVLIGTAVVGATTMIFSIIVLLTHGLTENLDKLSLLHPPFLLGLITGGAVIYWFTGASIQAVSTGAYRAVEFIKANIRLEGATRASVEDSKRVVEICTQYAQKGMFNIFLTVFFSTLAFAFLEPYFFIGYLISIALFGLYQAIFMANAGGAWDNAKKVVEVDLKEKGTPLHAATVIGDTVGDPFKDTSSVAMNPVIKFTTLFGLLAVELAVTLDRGGRGRWSADGWRRSSSPSRWCSSGGRSTACGSARWRADGTESVIEHLVQVLTDPAALYELVAVGRIRRARRDRVHGDRAPHRLLPAGRLAPDHGGPRRRRRRARHLAPERAPDAWRRSSGTASATPSATGRARASSRARTRAGSAGRTWCGRASSTSATGEDHRPGPVHPDHPDVRAGGGRRRDGWSTGASSPTTSSGGIGWVAGLTWAGYLLGRTIPDIGRYIHIVDRRRHRPVGDPDRRGMVAGPRARDAAVARAAIEMFRLIPREERFFELFEEQARNIVAAAGRLREMVFDFSDAPAKAMAIKELEHAGDVLTHDLIRKINTTFITPFDREDVYALASRLDDVLDLIEAAADRLVLYRIEEPTSGARAFAEVIVKTAESVQAAVACSGRRARAITSTASR